jgi:hypothetical protein
MSACRHIWSNRTCRAAQPVGLLGRTRLNRVDIAGMAVRFGGAETLNAHHNHLKITTRRPASRMMLDSLLHRSDPISSEERVISIFMRFTPVEHCLMSLSLSLSSSREREAAILRGPRKKTHSQKSQMESLIHFDDRKNATWRPRRHKRARPNTRK